MKKFFLVSYLIMSLLACKKIIQVDAKNALPKIVIEGKLTDDFGVQTVVVSNTVDYDTREENPKISGASVTVTDTKGAVFNFLESAPGIYTAKMQGSYGMTYRLDVKVNDQDYVGTSTMPTLVKLDSIGIIANDFFGRERVNPVIYFTDPKKETNFYHFNLSINGKLSKRTYVASDKFSNGNVNRVQFFYDDDDTQALKTGDKIMVEMECTDKNIYNYWYSLAQQASNGPNQGATPANPTSNISNGALGYFSVNTSERVTVTFK